MLETSRPYYKKETFSSWAASPLLPRPLVLFLWASQPAASPSAACVGSLLQVLRSSCVASEDPSVFISFQISILMKAVSESSREQMGGCHYTLLMRRAALAPCVPELTATLVILPLFPGPSQEHSQFWQEERVCSF